VPAAAALAAPAAAAQSPAQPVAEMLAAPKLVRYIEPEIPARIRSRLRPSSEVTVVFKIQPDGSVSNVGIRATTARALDPVVLDAVRQWRYDSVPEEREHVVQLVFNLTE
jgi:TonB family protein